MKRLIEFLKNITIRKHYLLKFLINPKEGYLYQSGWIRSFKSRKPVDVQGQPIPWLTIPLIDLLKDRLNTTHKIFEYGAGNSTHFYARSTSTVTSVEHNLLWYELLNKDVTSNVQLIFADINVGNEYVNAIEQEGVKYDIIIIDGQKRNLCCKKSTEFLTESGVIILDDSERAEYYDGIKYLQDCKFKKLDFWGLAPGNTVYKSSTLFYRDSNCFNI